MDELKVKLSNKRKNHNTARNSSSKSYKNKSDGKARPSFVRGTETEKLKLALRDIKKIQIEKEKTRIDLLVQKKEALEQEHTETAVIELKSVGLEILRIQDQIGVLKKLNIDVLILAGSRKYELEEGDWKYSWGDEFQNFSSATVIRVFSILLNLKAVRTLFENRKNGKSISYELKHTPRRKNKKSKLIKNNNMEHPASREGNYQDEFLSKNKATKRVSKPIEESLFFDSLAQSNKKDKQAQKKKRKRIEDEKQEKWNDNLREDRMKKKKPKNRAGQRERKARLLLENAKRLPSNRNVDEKELLRKLIISVSKRKQRETNKEKSHETHSGDAPVDDQSLHPSWIAKKRQKEKEAELAKEAAQKKSHITFD